MRGDGRRVERAGYRRAAAPGGVQWTRMRTHRAMERPTERRVRRNDPRRARTRRAVGCRGPPRREAQVHVPRVDPAGFRAEAARNATFERRRDSPDKIGGAMIRSSAYPFEVSGPGRASIAPGAFSWIDSDIESGPTGRSPRIRRNAVHRDIPTLTRRTSPRLRDPDNESGRDCNRSRSHSIARRRIRSGDRDRRSNSFSGVLRGLGHPEGNVTRSRERANADATTAVQGRPDVASTRELEPAGTDTHHAQLGPP
ncbi:hypothetical protein EHYA_00867 [Embleya hyalina]|uniref:Uncharacterized protein n=1 Tax=Embleya hyalina TaxID=516124 RepID=A0A401YF40_9ACTN|nr:hypothetical protein EHYA_00867 [Embleya hyalina]